MDTQVTKLVYTLKGGVKLEILYHFEDGDLYMVTKKTTNGFFREYMVDGGFYLDSNERNVHTMNFSVEEIMALWKKYNGEFDEDFTMGDLFWNHD